jgi:hypothetical protein
MAVRPAPISSGKRRGEGGSEINDLELPVYGGQKNGPRAVFLNLILIPAS